MYWRTSDVIRVSDELTKSRPLIEKALGRDIGPELISVSIREVCERVTAAEAEVERLQRKPPKHNSLSTCLVCDLEAEIERLRAGIRGLLGLIDSGVLRKSRMSSGMDYVIYEARKALREVAADGEN